MKKMLHRRGFTLIELVVAIAVFAVIVSVAVGGFVGALRSQRQVSALISVNNNVSLALEEMAREIRTGRNFCDLAFPCPADGSGLTFFNAHGDLVTYQIGRASCRERV